MDHSKNELVIKEKITDNCINYEDISAKDNFIENKNHEDFKHHNKINHIKLDKGNILLNYTPANFKFKKDSNPFKYKSKSLRNQVIQDFMNSYYSTDQNKNLVKYTTNKIFTNH